MARETSGSWNTKSLKIYVFKQISILQIYDGHVAGRLHDVSHMEGSCQPNLVLETGPVLVVRRDAGW